MLKIPNFLHCRLLSTKSLKPNLTNLLLTMPKEQKHIAEAQKQRRKLKEKLAKYVPGRVALQVLGTGAKGAPRSLYVFSDQARYLFNCGEGTQRLAHEHKMKLAKLEHIFITQPTWKNIGGLPGTSLTMQDVGVPQITLHGPKGLEEIFTATKRFVVIRDLKIFMADCNENTWFEDNVMKVTYVPLKRTLKEESDIASDDDHTKGLQIGSMDIKEDVSTSTRREGKRKSRKRTRSLASSDEEVIEDDTDYYAHEQSGTRTQPEVIPPEKQLDLQEQCKDKGISMAYICRLQPRPGALNLDECVKAGVPPGPLLGKLKAGEDVTLPNGTVVLSKDVCEPDDPGPVFIVVDCPSEEFLDDLVNNEEFKKHQACCEVDENLAYLVVHFSPKNVIDHPSYKEWINKFSLSTQHLILNETNECMGSVAVHRIQHKLNLLSNEMFPLLADKGTKVTSEEACSSLSSKRFKCDVEETEEKPSTTPYISPNTFCTFHLRPKKGLDRSSELQLVPNEYVDETMSIEMFPDALEELRVKLSKSRNGLKGEGYPKVLFLGTGSCIPNKTRNTSGILLQTSATKNILIDCGEGTYGQIVRFFGQKQSDVVLANLHAVYVSHLHADHHIGLLGILQGRQRALEGLGLPLKPVYLLAPRQIMVWLAFYDNCFEDVREMFQLVPNTDMLLNYNSLSNREALMSDLDMTEINTCYVKHCPNAFGVAFKHQDGYKLTYSGDTMPSESLVELGSGSDVLIHEATMEDELAHEAVVKMHSTTSQAIEIGRKMKAKNIILTHFSQRYAKLPRFNENFAENISIAFDNMQVRLDELPLVPHLYPALKLMFAEHYEELEHKAVKRQLKIDREREHVEEKLRQTQQNQNKN